MFWHIHNRSRLRPSIACFGLFHEPGLCLMQVMKGDGDGDDCHCKQMIDQFDCVAFSL